MDGDESLILNIPPALLAALWPADRTIVGLRVCKALHEHLVHSRATLTRAQGECNFSQEQLQQDLLRLNPIQWSLTWHRAPCEALLAALNKTSTETNLTRLDLSDSSLGDTEVWQLVSLLGRCRSLVSLNLAGTRAVYKASRGSMAGLLENCKVADLNLSRNHIGRGASAEHCVLTGVLTGCHGLARLDLSGNSMAVHGVRVLSRDVFEHCTALTDLRLGCNKLQSFGTEVLVANIGKCKSLCQLDLSQNGIGDGGATWLAEALSRCRTLRHLNLHGNEIMYEGTRELAEEAVSFVDRKLTLNLSGNWLDIQTLLELFEGASQCEVIWQSQ